MFKDVRNLKIIVGVLVIFQLFSLYKIHQCTDDIISLEYISKKHTEIQETTLQIIKDLGTAITNLQNKE